MAADRAYVPGGRLGPARDALDAMSARLIARFVRAGATRVDPAALRPADRLLDLYGEALRQRAFTVEQADGSELFLRPDFTLPILDLHQGAQADAARYCYLGPVWRRQDFGSKRPSEFLQAGIEVFGEDAGAADAETFALMLDALREEGVDEPQILIGDLGLVFALLDAIPMSARRRAGLRRHFWRPERFHDLVRRHRRLPPQPSALRARLLESDDISEICAEQGAILGVRDIDDIAARVAALREERASESLRMADARLIDAALAISGPAGEAHAALSALTREAGRDISPALDRFARRIDALNARGVNADALPFSAGFGRTFEYYDGFVFEFSAPGRPDLPPLAAGGRYDGLSAALGLPDAPAVGAMIRPEALLAAGAS